MILARRMAFILLILFAALGLIWPVSQAGPLPPYIRLHILANSDEAEDQALKAKVRDAVLEQTGGWFDEAESLEDSRDILFGRLGELERNAERVLQESGKPRPVKAYYGAFVFPDRCYGALTLPAGEYEALRLVIGEGKGAKWWCVVFPPLCVTEAAVTAGAEARGPEARDSAPEVQVKPRLKILDMLRDWTDG
jgi:stage II sporulation protein R